MTTIQNGVFTGSNTFEYQLIGVVIYILILVANYKIFEKCGEKGWKGLIPIYSNYMEFKLFWGNTLYFWISLVCAVLTVVPIIRVIAYIVEFIIAVKLAFKMSYSFGHGIGFGLGLCCLPNIFTFILGFGESRYHGVSGKTQFEAEFESKVNETLNNAGVNDVNFDKTVNKDNVVDVEAKEVNNENTEVIHTVDEDKKEGE